MKRNWCRMWITSASARLCISVSSSSCPCGPGSPQRFHHGRGPAGGGVNRKARADFTFIMALPIMVAACLFELLKNLSALTAGDLAVLAIGFVTAFIVGYLSIVWFMKFLQRSTLTAFGVYRILLAIFTVYYFYL